jgi:zinc protease
MAAVLAGCGLLFDAAAAAAQSAQGSQSPTIEAAVPPDASVRRGVLANGMRYAVTKARRASGTLSIRLGIRVGSYDEADEERGLAHFIEHMAFRSTRSFPDSAMDTAFAAKGVAFGRDLNASTSTVATRYQLDLPTAKDDDVREGLRWLRDVADGVVFNAADVDKERGVVLAEKEARDGPASAADLAVAGFQAPGLRSTHREPIGTDVVLRAATPQQLSSFYQRWYRPENAVVVMVGDLSLEQMEGLVRDAFESWRPTGAAPARAQRVPPDPNRTLDAFSLTAPAVLGLLQACRLTASDSEPLNDIAAFRRRAMRDIVQQILDQRLAVLRNFNTNQLVGARLEGVDNGTDAHSTCLIVVPTGDGWEPALRAAQLELRRFRDAGPTELEVEAGVEAVRSRLRAEITEQKNQSSAELGEDILDLELQGGSLIEARQALRAYDLAVEDLSTADVHGAFLHEWSGAGPLLSSVLAAPPPAETLKAAWASNEAAAALGAYEDRKAVVWDYKFGPVGEVASRTPVPFGDYVRFQFRNGLVFKFKKTDFEKDGAYLLVRFGSGRREIENRAYLPAAVGGALFVLGGVSKLNFNEVQRLSGPEIRQFGIRIGNDGFYMGARVIRANLADDLNVLAAYMSDPGFDATIDPALHEAVELAYRGYRTSPYQVATEALGRSALSGGDLVAPLKSTFDGVDHATISQLLRPAVTSDPIEVILVGDIDEKAAVQLVASTFGALPARPVTARSRNDTDFLRFALTAPPPIHATHQGPADKALIEAVWPLYVATPERRREEYAITVLARIFDDELRRRVRVELGKSYAPQVVTRTPDNADQGFLAAAVEAYPGDVAALESEMLAVAANLKAGGINANQLEAARAPMLAHDRQRLATNDWWAGGLADTGGGEQALHDIIGYSDVIGSITLEEVKRVAAQWLGQDPTVVVAEPSTQSASAGAGRP